MPPRRLAVRSTGIPSPDHGGRPSAGGHVPWWVWVLVLWGVLGTLLAVSVGKVIQAADRRELRGQLPAREDGEDVASPAGRRAS